MQKKRISKSLCYKLSELFSSNFCLKISFTFFIVCYEKICYSFILQVSLEISLKLLCCEGYNLRLVLEPIHGHHPAACATLSMQCHNWLLSFLDRTYQNQFCFSFSNFFLVLFSDQNSISYERFDLEKCLKMKEFCVNLKKCCYIFYFFFNKADSMF